MCRELKERCTLDLHLSRALCIELTKGRIPHFDESHYVLTLDFALKMLDIHERRKCKIPVIIEGETGVGKTALIEMLSNLWNSPLTSEFKRVKNDILDDIRNGEFYA